MAKKKKTKPEEVEVKTSQEEVKESQETPEDNSSEASEEKSPTSSEPEVESPEKKTDEEKKKEEDDEPIANQNHIIIEEIDEESPAARRAHWYVIHTYSGHEHRVANTLIQRLETLNITGKVLELLIPTQDKILIKRGKKSTVKEKIFPGYMLIRMILDDDSWLAVRTTSGVTSFVGIGNKPTPLPPKEVESIKKFMSMEAPTYKSSFSLGEAVRIVEGPFADFLGSIDTIDEAKGKVKVLVSIFGRETPVELDFLQVTKI